MNTSHPSYRIKNKSRVRIPPRLIFSDPWCLLGFGLGSGLAPKAPGTFGTLAALPIYAVLAQLSLPAYLASLLILFVAGLVICQRCEERIQVSDHSGIVWDEMVGLLITLTAVPVTWPVTLTGFVLFRVFDVLKPWPIRLLDRNLHGGLGIMLDDAVAALFAALCLHGVLPYLTP